MAHNVIIMLLTTTDSQIPEVAHTLIIIASVENK